MPRRGRADVVRTVEEDGRLLRLRLARPPRNVLDVALVSRLHEALADVPATACGALLEAEGPNFSYGASVEEHAPEKIGAALPAFHALVKRALGLAVPLVVAVRGHCLGGGLELACACDVIFAARDARLGQPEVRLGAFAPAASVLLPLRVGEGAARDLLLSGRSVGPEEALRMGLVQFVADEPELAALAWLRAHVLTQSRTSVRVAARAARHLAGERVVEALDAMERLYLGEIARSPDAAEGVSAFLEKRPPRWRPPDAR